jgi:hypothetical protein
MLYFSGTALEFGRTSTKIVGVPTKIRNRHRSYNSEALLLKQICFVCYTECPDERYTYLLTYSWS